MGTVAGLGGAKWAAIPAVSAAETAIAGGSPKFQLRAQGIGVALSAAGEIVGVKAGIRKINLVGRTSLAGCMPDGAAKGEKLAEGAQRFIAGAETLSHFSARRRYRNIFPEEGQKESHRN